MAVLKHIKTGTLTALSAWELLDLVKIHFFSFPFPQHVILAGYSHKPSPATDAQFC